VILYIRIKEIIAMRLSENKNSRIFRVKYKSKDDENMISVKVPNKANSTQKKCQNVKKNDNLNFLEKTNTYWFSPLYSNVTLSLFI